MAINIISYITSFFIIWFGSGLIIRSIDRIAHSLKLSTFAVSFFILGILTSIPEIAVGTNALISHRPEIFVGNLLGGVVVIFLLVIPILAILGRGIRLNHQLDQSNLILSLLVIAAPSFTLIDHQVSNTEGLFLIIIYGILFYYIQSHHGFLNTSKALSSRSYSFIDLAKVAAGVALVSFSSQRVVNLTISFSQTLHIPAFYISLIALSLGTNLPELSLAVRSVFSGKKDIAFGDYLGSASANTLLFGVFTVFNAGEVLTTNSFLLTCIFIVAGLSLFYVFSRSQKILTSKEGLILLLTYVLFIAYEISRGLNG